MNGNTVNFHTTCKHDDMQMEATGNMTYTGDSMDGHIKSHESRAGKSMDSTIDITGKYEASLFISVRDYGLIKLKK